MVPARTELFPTRRSAPRSRRGLRRTIRHRAGRRRLAAVLPALCLLPLLVASILAGSAPAARGEGEPVWAWPLVEPRTVVSGFDEPDGPYGPGHRGLDLAGGDGGVRAVDGGVVRFTGMVAGRPVVSVMHEGGLISTYEPVIGALPVGRQVTAGTVIGSLDSSSTASHCGAQVCLHLGARRGERYLDPILLLEPRGPSVLKPLAGEGGVRSGGEGGDLGGTATGKRSGEAPRHTGERVHAGAADAVRGHGGTGGG